MLKVIEKIIITMILIENENLNKLKINDINYKDNIEQNDLYNNIQNDKVSKLINQNIENLSEKINEIKINNIIIGNNNNNLENEDIKNENLIIMMKE